jgi:hypothetical protein
VRRAGVADRGGEVVDDRLLRDAQPASERPDGACVRAGDDQPVDLLRRELGGLEGRVPRLLA